MNIITVPFNSRSDPRANQSKLGIQRQLTSKGFKTLAQISTLNWTTGERSNLYIWPIFLFCMMKFKYFEVIKRAYPLRRYAFAFAGFNSIALFASATASVCQHLANKLPTEMKQTYKIRNKKYSKAYKSTFQDRLTVENVLPKFGSFPISLSQIYLWIGIHS